MRLFLSKSSNMSEKTMETWSFQLNSMICSIKVILFNCFFTSKLMRQFEDFQTLCGANTGRLSVYHLRMKESAKWKTSFCQHECIKILPRNT